MAGDIKFNYPLYILASLQKGGENIAFSTQQGELTYKQFRNSVILFAMHLQVRGVGPGSVVAFKGFDEPTYAAMVLAAGLNGAAYVDATEAALSNSELRITHLVHGTSKIQSENPNVHRLDKTWMVPPAGVDISKAAFKGFEKPGALAACLQTSGTTGKPKIIPFSAAAIHLSITSRLSRMTEAMTVTTLAPTGTALSLGWILGTLAKGGRFCFQMPLDAAKRNNVDLVLGSPKQFQNYLRGAEAADGHRIRYAFMAGATAPLALRREIFKHFRTMRVGYGATEAGGAVTHRFVDEADIEDMTLGKTMPWTTLEILDEEGRKVAPGETGFIRMKSGAMSPRYLGATGKDAESLRDGWFYTGDLGRLDENGDLVLIGRKDDRLNIGGVKVHALMIDNALTDIDGIEECAAFVWTNPETGIDQLAVAVATKSGHDSGEIEKRVVELCKARFEKNYIPEKVFFVSSLPRNPNGKLQRNRVSENLEAAELA